MPTSIAHSFIVLLPDIVVVILYVMKLSCFRRLYKLPRLAVRAGTACFVAIEYVRTAAVTSVWHSSGMHHIRCCGSLL